MKIITKIFRRFDLWQQRHRFPAFTYAVIKKYSEDNAGREAALLTYYGFLALFPLLMILTTVTQAIVGNHPDIQNAIITNLTDYFPVMGNRLAEQVTALHRNNLALVVGILFALYGARGAADILRHTVRKLWGVPKDQTENFLKAFIKSLVIIIVGGIALLGGSILSGIAAGAGQGWEFRAVSLAINFVVLYWLFDFILNLSLPRHVKAGEIRLGALTAATGLTVLQILGGYIISRELRSLDALYSYFALSLGLLFWIYLQAQVLCYATTISVVSARKLWPRSFYKNS